MKQRPGSEDSRAGTPTFHCCAVQEEAWQSLLFGVTPPCHTTASVCAREYHQVGLLEP